MQKYSRPQRSHAVTRNDARRQANARLARTVVLGGLATVAALFWLGDQYGIERAIMLEFLSLTLLFVGALVLLGALGALLLWLFKRGVTAAQDTPDMPDYEKDKN